MAALTTSPPLPSSDPAPSHRAPSSSLPWLVLLIALVASLSTWQWSNYDRSRGASQRAEQEARRIIQDFESSLSSLEQVVRGVTATAALDRPMTRAAWDAYVDGLRLGSTFGESVASIAFAERVDVASLDAHLARWRRVDPGYRIWPASPQAVRYPIVLMRRLVTREAPPLGFDPFTSPERQAAMRDALARRDVAYTGGVIPKAANASASPASPVVILVAPVFGSSAATREDGFVGLGLRPDVLLSRIVGDAKHVRATLISATGESGPLQVRIGGDAGADDEVAVESRHIERGGARWTLSVAVSDASVRGVEGTGLLALLLAASAAVFGIARRLDRARVKVLENLARERAASDAKFQAFAQDAPFLIWLADAQLQPTYVNAVWTDVTGRTAEEATGRGWREVIHPDDLPAMIEQLRDLVRTHAACTVRARMLTHDRGYRWFLASLRPRRDAAGQLLGFIGIALDVHDLKSAEEAREESSARLVEVLDAIPVPVCAKNAEGIWVFANQAAADFHGVPVEALTGRRNDELWHGRQAAALTAQDHEALETGRVVQTEELHQRASGNGEAWVLKTKQSVTGPDGRDMVVVTVVDISERREARLALERERALLRAVLDGAPACIFAKDSRKRYILLNPEVERFMGVRPDSFLGRTDQDFFGEEDAARNSHQDDEVLVQGRTLRSEEWFTDPEGRRHWVLKIKCPVTLSTGERLLVGWMLDITDRKREELELLASREQLGLLHRLATASLAGAAADAAANEAVGGLAGAIDGARVAFARFDDASALRVSTVARHQNAPALLSGEPVPAAMPALVETLAGARTVMCHDTALHPEGAGAEASGARAFIAVPVRGRARTLGALVVDVARPRVWSEWDCRVVAEVADALGASLDADASRHERDAALHEAESSRHFLESLVNALPNPLFVKDREHRMVLVNGEFAAWAGRSPDSLLGRTDDTFVTEGRAQDSWDEDEYVFEHPGVHFVEIASRLPHARSRNILQSKSVVTLGDGKQYVVGTAIPIDDLIAARERAQASERFLDAVFDAVPQPLFVKDRAHRWVRMNRAFAEVVGLPREQLLGRCDADVMPPALAAAAYAEDDQIFATGERREKEIRARTIHGDGRWMQSSKARVVLENGEEYLVGVTSDIQPLMDERQRAEASERFLAQILDALPIPVLAKDEASRWVLANETYLRRCGVTREQALGRSDGEIFGEAEGSRIRAQDLAVLESGEPQVVEESFRLGTGENRWILKTKVIIGEVGSRRLILTSAVDITERRQAEVSMRRNREFLDAVLHTLPVAVVVKDSEHRYVVANREVLAFLDCSAQDMIGKTDRDIYDTATAATNIEEDDQLLATLGHLQTEQHYILGDGRARWVLKSKRAFQLDDGEAYIIVSLIDIDQRKSAELALESSRQFLDIVINAIPNGVTVKDEASRYLMTNSAFAQWCGRDKMALVGLRDEDVVDAETAQRNRSEDAEVLRTGRSLVFEARMRRADGQESHWLKHKTLVDLPNGDRHVLTVSTDITDRKALEAQTVVSRRRLEMLNRLSMRTLAGDSADDIRTFAAHALAALVSDTRVTIAAVDDSEPQRALVTVGDDHAFETPAAQASRLTAFPACWEAMHDGQLMVVSSTQSERLTDEERARLLQGGNCALIAAPMRRRQRLLGIVLVESCRDRSWSSDEIQTVTELTAALTAALEFRDSVLERERAEEALRASKALLDGIINALPTGIVVKDESRRWVIGNAAMTRITGRSLEEVIGRTNLEIYGPDIGTMLDAEDEHTLASAEPMSVEWRVVNPKSSRPWVVKTKSRLLLPDGRRFLISALSDVTPQKEAALEVEHSRRFLDALLNALPQSVYVRDGTGRTILANSAYYSLTRRTPEEVLGRTSREVFGEDVARMLDAQDREAWDAGRVVYFEQETRDDRIAAEWQLKSKAPVTMPDGSRYLVCTSSDISQLKRAVTSVERGKQFVETLINAVPQGIFVKDEAGRWIMANEPFLRFGGYTLVDLLGRTNREIYGPERGAHFDRQDQLAWASPDTIIYEEEAPETDCDKRWQLKSKTAVRLTDGSRYLVCTTTDVTDRRKSEQALQRNRQFLDSILDAVPMPIFVKDERHRLTIVNTAAEQMHQRPRSELIGKTDFDLHDAAYAQATWLEDDEVLARGGVINAESLIEFENQAPRWIMKSKVATTLDDGSRYTIAVLLDITERKRAEQDAVDARARLEILNGISADMTTAVAVPDVVRRAVDRMAAALSGIDVSIWSRSSPTMLRLHVFSGPSSGLLVPGLELDLTHLPGYRRELDAGEMVVVEDALLDERVREEPLPGLARITRAFIDMPIRGANSAHSRDILTLSTTTRRVWTQHERQTIVEVGDALALAYLRANAEVERARVEQELRDNEATLRATVWASDLGLWSWDLVSGAVHFSPRWKAQLGFAPEELVDSFDSWRERVHPDDLEAATSAIQSALASGNERYQAEFRLRHKDGSWRNILARAQIQRDTEGQPFRMVGGHIDVTDFRRAQEALRRHRDELEHLVAARTAEAVRAKELAEAANLAKSEFLANMSHELRTPMHAILSFSKLGLDRMGAGTVPLPKISTYLERIQQSGQRLLGLLNDLLDLSKLEAGKMRYDFADHDLREVAGGVAAELSAYARERKVNIVVRAGEVPVATRCDPVRVGQVVRNLLSNAIKFTEPGLDVTLEIAGGHTLVDADGTSVPASRVCVRDEGVGIPDSELETVFDKFVQSSKTKSGAGGTGLGLAICREIVGQHGGRIWAENNADRGASFTLLLPLHGKAEDGGREGGLRHVA